MLRTGAVSFHKTYLSQQRKLQGQGPAAEDQLLTQQRASTGLERGGGEDGRQGEASPTNEPDSWNCQPSFTILEGGGGGQEKVV